MRKIICLIAAMAIGSGIMPASAAPALVGSLPTASFAGGGAEYAQLRGERRDVRRARREVRGERRDLRRADTARERRMERRELRAARRDLRRQRRDVRDVRRNRRIYGNRGRGRATGAAIAGVVGSLVGGAIAANQSGGRSVAYCENRYRSYDRRSGTYLGNDGSRHACP